MPEVTVVYWRDIPAQVVSGRGRSATKRVLDTRFEQAIDRAAMRSGAADTDAYLGEWRRARQDAPGDSPAEAVESLARALEASHDADRLRALIAAGGWARPDGDADSGV